MGQNADDEDDGDDQRRCSGDDHGDDHGCVSIAPDHDGDHGPSSDELHRGDHEDQGSCAGHADAEPTSISVNGLTADEEAAEVDDAAADDDKNVSLNLPNFD